MPQIFEDAVEGLAQGCASQAADGAALDQQVQSTHGRRERAKQIEDVDDSVPVLVRDGVALQQVSKDSERRQEHGHSTVRLGHVRLPVGTSGIEVIHANPADGFRRAGDRGGTWDSVDGKHVVLEARDKARLFEGRAQAGRSEWELVNVQIQKRGSI